MNGSDAKAVTTIAKCIERIIPELGENPTREGLIDTPARVASMYLEMTEGLRIPPPKMTTFQKGSCDEMVTILDLDYSSLCEHHFAPFFGKVHIGYLPGERLAGLSKFGRVVDWFSRRPQIQEAMTSQIADFLNESLSPKGLIVVVSGSHSCMSMRGVRKQNHSTITSAIRGSIPKEEFFEILKLRT